MGLATTSWNLTQDMHSHHLPQGLRVPAWTLSPPRVGLESVVKGFLQRLSGSFILLPCQVITKTM